MKVKGLRWVVIGLIMLITIINYLDRGTLNYMWVANIDYRLLPEAEALSDKGNHAALVGDQYILTAANGNRDSVSVANVQMKEKNGNTLSLLPHLLRCFFLRIMHWAKKKPQRCCKSPLYSWQTSPVSPMH